jgi:hypothetical protein
MNGFDPTPVQEVMGQMNRTLDIFGQLIKAHRKAVLDGDGRTEAEIRTQAEAVFHQIMDENISLVQAMKKAMEAAKVPSAMRDLAWEMLLR